MDEKSTINIRRMSGEQEIICHDYARVHRGGMEALRCYWRGCSGKALNRAPHLGHSIR
jgi:hypothetical protein